MPTMQHQALTAPDAIHPAFYITGTDPATTYPTQIAADQVWWDTTNKLLKKRNAGNTGWDTIDISHASLSGLATGDPHTQYLLRSLGTTKGDILVYNGSAWVRLAVSGTDGDVLAADSTAPEGVAWTGFGGTLSLNLDDLTDVNAPTPTNGHVLTWDSTPGEWVASAPGVPTMALDDLSDTVITSPANKEHLEYNGTNWVNSSTLNDRRMTIAVQFGDGTNAIVAASEREQWLECNFDGTIEGNSLLADASGDFVVDIWKDTYANYPPVVGDSITASAKPTLSSAAKSEDNTLTGWTTTITRGDILKFHVDSATTVKAVTLNLRIVKT